MNDHVTNRQPRRRPAASLAALVAAGTLAAVLGTWYARAPRVEAAEPPTATSVQPESSAPTASSASSASSVASAASAATPGSYADLLARVAPAVVTVHSEHIVTETRMQGGDDFFRRFFGDQMPAPAPREASGLGSGVVVSADGYILTNNHVVDGARKIRVDFTDGRTLDARLVGTDRPSDVAVLQVDATGLQTLPLGDSDKARVGDVVFAVGNPLGLGQTVTMGIVSAKGRVTTGGDDSYENFIQTDAPINHGNSGGALVNTRGELVGINSQIMSPVGYNIGIGFAVPVNMAHRVMQQLIDTGHVRRGMLGVTVQGLDGDMAKSLGLTDTHGAIVTDVQPDSPAAHAGLATGDVILALNGSAVDSSNDLRNEIAPLGPDATVHLRVSRAGETRDVTATLVELPSSEDGTVSRTAMTSTGRHGMRVEPLTPDVARELHSDSRSGLVVTDVDPDGAAADAGLRPGDVIEQVNGKPVAAPDELRTALDSTTDKPALLLVARQGRRVFMTLDAGA